MNRMWNLLGLVERVWRNKQRNEEQHCFIDLKSFRSAERSREELANFHP